MFHSSVRTYLIAAALLLLLPATTAASETRAASGPLDGQIFIGHVGPASDPDFAEELHFNHGLFWSKLCLVCGYSPGPYWTRQIGADVQFVAELRGQSGSTFRYQGVIAEDSAAVDVHWTKDRWYWSMDRDLVFRGRLASDRTAISAADARQRARAAAQDTLPEWCP